MRTSTTVVVSLPAISFELSCTVCLPHLGARFGIPFAATYAASQREAQVLIGHISLENAPFLHRPTVLESGDCIQIEERVF
jgi:hypothetical protein